MDMAHGNPVLEAQIRTALQGLQALFEARAEAYNRGDPVQAALAEQDIAPAMRRIGDSYRNEEARQTWYRQAEDFEKADPEEREHILMPIATGLGLLIAAPLALAFGIVGGVVFTAGSILYGAGRLAQGLGGLLTGGWLR